MIAVIGKHTTL